MRGITEILVAEQQLLVVADDASLPKAQPANFTHAGSWADEATFTLAVVAVNGAPSAWSLGVKFQYVLAHSGASKFRYQSRTWFDLSADNIETNVVEGVGWYAGAHTPPMAGEFGIVATEADSLSSPIVVQRTIRHFGADVRVLLDPQFTGGTSPSLSITLLRHLKG